MQVSYAIRYNVKNFGKYRLEIAIYSLVQGFFYIYHVFQFNGVMI